MTEAEGYIEDIFDGCYRCVSRQVEALGWKDLAVPAAGIALMTPFAQPAQAAPNALPYGAERTDIVLPYDQTQQPAQRQQRPQQPQQATKEQSWQQAQAAVNFIVGRPTEIRKETSESMVQAFPNGIGGKTPLAFITWDGVIHLSPTVSQYLDYPNSMVYVQGLAELIHEACHLKLFFEDGGPSATPQSYTRAVNESLTNQMAIQMAPDVIKQFFPWLTNQKTLAWDINRALLQQTPEQYH